MSCSLILTLFLAAAEPGPVPQRIPNVPSATVPPATTFTGQKFPPPGSAADQALLGELLLAQANMLAQRAWAVMATQRLHDGKYEERLAALRTGQPAEAAGKTGQLERRLVATWGEVTRILAARWPVDGRIGCRPQAISFEVLMTPVEGDKGSRLEATRASARSCLERQQLVVRPLDKANHDLEAVWREADEALAGAQAGK
jgi:hypothetical protein